ncbi:MAG TPA: DinB family protein [Bryobacteraceae bacterium]|jgi:hypothetical protein|nr:DinB family protein [Bryobacteraceae bacterium]
MNPYASFINGEPVGIIRATAARLDNAVKTHDKATLNRSPAPGKWSVREILCHLADTEVVFAFRLRQALAEDHHVIQPFDQDKWAKTYAHYDAQAAAAVFSVVRQWNLALIGTLKPEALAKTLHHPERGDMNLQTVVETMAGHDLNHLRQIDAILA